MMEMSWSLDLTKKVETTFCPQNSKGRKKSISISLMDQVGNKNQEINKKTLNISKRAYYKNMSKYLELVEVSEGVIVLRRSDNKNSPLVKIEFSEEVKKLLNGMEFDVAKEMIKSGIESLNADINLDNLDEDLFENIFKEETQSRVLH